MMIKNGIPVSLSYRPPIGDDPGRVIVDDRLLNDECSEVQNIVRRWIRKCILPRKSPLHGCTSYGIKHLLEHDTGIYLTNNQFKHAMLLEGYKPVDSTELNWVYCISKKSPAFGAWDREKGDWLEL